MRKLYILCVIGLAVIVSSLAFAQGESITLTTYYPAPFGVYNEMRANKMVIGEADSSTTPASSFDGGLTFKPIDEPDVFQTFERGTMYYDNTDNVFKYSDDGSNWQAMGGEAIPPGLCMFKFSGSCPDGWSRNSALDDKTIRGAATPGGTGGSDSHSHTGPSHTHSGTTSGSGSKVVRQNLPPGGVETSVAPPHTHSFTTGASGTGPTSSVSSWPPYTNVIICCKD